MDEDGRWTNDFYDDDEEELQKDLFLTFKTGKENYAVSISYVIEVVGMQKISRVPDLPDFVQGVINLRGHIIPVMDIRMRFGMDIRAYTEKTCIIVVSVTDTLVGIVVDSVTDVVEIPESVISELPKIDQTPNRCYIQGVGRIGNLVSVILDIETLLYGSV